MHNYLMEVDRYFKGPTRFQVEAENKTEAMEKARELLNHDGCRYDDSIIDSIRCIRKMKPSFGK